VAGDSNKLERAITNLLTNSMQACARGGSVTLRVKHHNGKVQIEVQDDGPGVAPEIRESLFEPFVSEGKPDGTGLGLAIVRSIVTAHGGVVSLIPSESGALFRIALPECSGSSAIDSGEYAPVKVALPASSASD
jgi:signal transduction histidine kinase